MAQDNSAHAGKSESRRKFFGAFGLVVAVAAAASSATQFLFGGKKAQRNARAVTPHPTSVPRKQQTV